MRSATKPKRSSSSVPSRCFATFRNRNSLISCQWRIQHFAKGDTILREGDATNDLLIVRDGFVEVYVNKGDKKIHITLLGPTSYFGEMSVFDE